MYYYGYNGGYGNYMVISHGNGVETYYGHCSQLYVQTGETVEIAARVVPGFKAGNKLKEALN